MVNTPSPAPLAPTRAASAPGVVVFAHVPPPHHGQSYAVQLLLERLRLPATKPSEELRVFHVDARLSDDIEAIGRFQPRKILRLLRYCLEAIGHRLRHRARILYYIPAAPMRSAVYRDWLVMALCRPFFDRIVLHWEAAGLGEWLQSVAKPWERALTHRLLDRHTASVVLAEYGRIDASAFRAREVFVVPNGIPDPCPDYDAALVTHRAARARALARAANGPGAAPSPPLLCQALYLSLCIPEKGLFDALDAVALANTALERRGSQVRIQLSVAGKFWREEDRTRFDARCREPDLQLPGAVSAAGPERAGAVVYRGFVGPAEKADLFRASDIFLFPSYYPAESFGLAVAEAMAFGLPVIAARWRHLPELFPPDYPYLVTPKAPQEIADALGRWLQAGESSALRARFLERFTAEAYGRGLRRAILGAIQA